MPKVLVTGFAGFIGSHLTERLLNEGYIVAGIDDFNDFYEPKIKEINISSFKNHKNFSCNRFDIRDKDLLDDLVSAYKPEIIIHLAARAGVRPSIELPVLYEGVNVLGTLNLLETARKMRGWEKGITVDEYSDAAGVKRVYYAEDEDGRKALVRPGISYDRRLRRMAFNGYWLQIGDAESCFVSERRSWGSDISHIKNSLFTCSVYSVSSDKKVSGSVEKFEALEKLYKRIEATVRGRRSKQEYRERERERAKAQNERRRSEERLRQLLSD